jgi:hypothetical protein
MGLVTTTVAGKVIEEQLIEAAFLSNLDYHHAGKEITLRCVTSQYFLQQPHGGSIATSSTNGKRNVFCSKSTGIHTPIFVIQKPSVGLAKCL